MTLYPFHNGPNQYGTRKGTLGLALHMTEGNGGDGDLAYLLGDPARGVSANFFSHEDGTIHQLMPLSQASGSMNPKDRSSDKGYYSDKNLKAVLGTHWTNPNAYSISIEIGGKRAAGPNAKQVEACIAWGRDMRDRYPSLVGAYGHADQTDTKGCPGTTPAMKAIFAGIGGHGLFTEDEDVQSFTLVDGPPADVAVKDAGTLYLRLKDGKTYPAAVGTTRKAAIPIRLLAPIVKGKPNTDDWTLGRLIGDEAAFVLERNLIVKPVEPPIANCDKAVADAIAADRALAHIEY